MQVGEELRCFSIVSLRTLCLSPASLTAEQKKPRPVSSSFVMLLLSTRIFDYLKLYKPSCVSTSRDTELHTDTWILNKIFNHYMATGYKTELTSE